MSDATLINGKGRYVHGPLVDLAVLQVEQGRRYRFRLISISCDPNFIFSIDGHKMTIIEVDGEYTRPLTVESIQIFAGAYRLFLLSCLVAYQENRSTLLVCSACRSESRQLLGTRSAQLRSARPLERFRQRYQLCNPAILARTYWRPSLFT